MFMFNVVRLIHDYTDSIMKQWIENLHRQKALKDSYIIQKWFRQKIHWSLVSSPAAPHEKYLVTSCLCCLRMSCDYLPHSHRTSY